MPAFRSFQRFLSASFAAPKAMLSRLKWTLDRHSDFLENIEGEDGVEVRKNYKGGITISGGGGSSRGVAWSGIVFHSGVPKLDFTRVGNDPDNDPSTYGMFGIDDNGVYQGSVEGEILVLDRTSGEATFENTDDTDPAPYSEGGTKEYFLVAQYLRDENGGIEKDENDDPIYVPLYNRSCGDVHLFGGAFDVAGTPAIDKGVFLRGWKKTGAEVAWVQMTTAEVEVNAPTKIWTDFIDGIDEYPWYGFRPMWDYPRTQ